MALGALIGVIVLWREPLTATFLRLRRRHRSWAELQLARLEVIGTGLGREREPGETAVEYAAALQRTVLRDPAVNEVAAAITADGFAPTRLSTAERTDVEQRLTALAKA